MNGPGDKLLHYYIHASFIGGDRLKMATPNSVKLFRCKGMQIVTSLITFIIIFIIECVAIHYTESKQAIHLL